MINSSQTIKYEKQWFDGQKYIKLQKEKILERISKFSWKLYLEIWWKFMYDAHASRVLPWFIPESKKIIFYDLREQIDIFFCVSAEDIINNRQITNEEIDYSEHTKKFLLDFEKNIEIKPKLIINKINSDGNLKIIDSFRDKFINLWYEVYKRYKINGYPIVTNNILSKNWFWKDDYIKSDKNLILVTWIASSSGKMSTCLGQIYNDFLNKIESWYAKYETFPVWNIDLNHPINLAYEAATADIWDYNAYDLLYEKHTWIKSVNYNRDIEAFSIVKSICDKFLSEQNYTRNYNSPTDMWISNAWFCITDDKICCLSSLAEIKRRKYWYKQMLQRWEWNINWVYKCFELEQKSNKYIKNK